MIPQRPLSRQSHLVFGFTAVLLFGWLTAEAWSDGPASGRPQKAKTRSALRKASQPAPTDDQTLPAYQALTRGTVHLDVVAENDEAWRGTGWLLDAERRLIVTNMHVSSGSNLDLNDRSIDAWFPVVKDGEAIHDIEYYTKNVRKIHGNVIYTDSVRDLALLQLESLPADAAALPLAKQSAKIGQLLHSLAGYPVGSEGLFIYTQGTSRAVYKRTLGTNVPGVMVLESQMPLNAGNSGGAIINDAGEVVAVHEGTMTSPSVKLVLMSVDISEVKAFLEEAMPLVQPESVANWNKRGDHHYEAGRYDLAMSDYNQVLKLDPKNAEATSSRGWVHYQNDDLDTAMAEFDAALELDPTLRVALWGRGTVYHDLGEDKKAVQEFTQAIRHTTDATELAVLYNDRGNAYYADEKYEQALADYDRSIAKNADDAWTHANRGDVLGQLGRYDEAFPSLDKAVALDNSNGEFWNIAGNLWFDRGNYEQAVRMYSNAILLGAAEPMFFRNRGSAQRQVGNYQDAIGDLLKAVELDRDEDEFWNELGLCWYDAEKYDQAVVAFGRATELDARNATYFENRGDAYTHLGNHEKAVEDFSKAIELEDTPELRTKRGRSYLALNDKRAAATDFDTAGIDADDEQAVSKEDAASRTHDRKYLIFYNKTKYPVKVFLRYYTKTTDGDWQWFPDSIIDPRNGYNWPMFDGKPYIMWPVDAETATTAVADETEWKINASRIRVFATIGDGTRGWFQYRTQDMVLVPESGYIGKSADDFDTAVIPFEE